MRELSIMVDESGEWGKLSKYYLITLVFHDQSEPVMPHIERYEQHLADASLPDIPFHAGPLLNGHADYETLVFCQVVIGQCGVSFPSEKAVGFSPVRNWPVIARVLLFHCIRA